MKENVVWGKFMNLERKFQNLDQDKLPNLSLWDSGSLWLIIINSCRDITRIKLDDKCGPINSKVLWNINEGDGDSLKGLVIFKFTIVVRKLLWMGVSKNLGPRPSSATY